jgi:PhnB protein
MKDSSSTNTSFFAPLLALRKVLEGIEFYRSAFGATELQRWSNPDGSVHVAEMAIDGAVFHLHEEVTRTREFSPETLGGVSAVIGLFTADPGALAVRAIAAGAIEETPDTSRRKHVSNNHKPDRKSETTFGSKKGAMVKKLNSRIRYRTLKFPFRTIAYLWGQPINGGETESSPGKKAGPVSPAGLP